MQPIRTLTDVLDDAAFISTERQRRLREVVHGDAPYGDRWDADLVTGILSFTGRAGWLDTPAHVVGTAAPGPGTWMWGWNNVNQLPADVVSWSDRAREFGARFGIAELTTAELPLQGDPRRDAVRYATATGLIAGGHPHYTADLGRGTIIAFVVEASLAALPAPSVITAATVIGETLENGALVDHERALEAYVELRGFGLERGGSVRTLTAYDGRLEVTVDDSGRISGMQGAFVLPEGPGPARD